MQERLFENALPEAGARRCHKSGQGIRDDQYGEWPEPGAATLGGERVIICGGITSFVGTQSNFSVHAAVAER